MRRKFTKEQKEAAIADLKKGMHVNAVAKEHDMSKALVWKLKQQAATAKPKKTRQQLVVSKLEDPSNFNVDAIPGMVEVKVPELFAMMKDLRAENAQLRAMLKAIL